MQNVSMIPDIHRYLMQHKRSVIRALAAGKMYGIKRGDEPYITLIPVSYGTFDAIERKNKRLKRPMISIIFKHSEHIVGSIRRRYDIHAIIEFHTKATRNDPPQRSSQRGLCLVELWLSNLTNDFLAMQALEEKTKGPWAV